MSDVGLAKACRRLDIPLPPRGYWAKQAYGHAAEKQPLPPVDKKLKAQSVKLDKSAEELLHMARNRASGKKVQYTERQRIHRLQNKLKEWDESPIGVILHDEAFAVGFAVAGAFVQIIALGKSGVWLQGKKACATGAAIKGC